MSNEVTTFLYFISTGFVIGFLFDIFRIFRKVIKTCNFIVYIQDLLFCLISGLIMLVMSYFTNRGELRWYMFFGALIGASLYFLIFSNFFVKMFAIILGFVVKFIMLLIKPFNIIIKRGIQLCGKLKRNQKQRKLRKKEQKKLKEISVQEQ